MLTPSKIRFVNNTSSRSFWKCSCLHLEHIIKCVPFIYLLIYIYISRVMYDYTAWRKFACMTKICLCIKLFTSLQYGLSKTFCLKLRDILVNFAKISNRQNRNLTRNLHCQPLVRIFITENWCCKHDYILYS